MYELVYCSKAKKDITNTEVENILNTSIEYNNSKGITGCLVYFENEFIQILEGNRGVVKELYGQIENDLRHDSVTLLSTSESSKRVFGEWSMAYYKPDEGWFERVNLELFKENLLTLSDLSAKPTLSMKLFWKLVRKRIRNSD